MRCAEACCLAGSSFKHICRPWQTYRYTNKERNRYTLTDTNHDFVHCGRDADDPGSTKYHTTATHTCRRGYLEQCHNFEPASPAMRCHYPVLLSCPAPGQRATKQRPVRCTGPRPTWLICGISNIPHNQAAGRACGARRGPRDLLG